MEFSIQLVVGAVVGWVVTTYLLPGKAAKARKVSRVDRSDWYFCRFEGEWYAVGEELQTRLEAIDEVDAMEVTRMLCSVPGKTQPCRMFVKNPRYNHPDEDLELFPDIDRDWYFERFNGIVVPVTVYMQRLLKAGETPMEIPPELVQHLPNLHRMCVKHPLLKPKST